MKMSIQGLAELAGHEGIVLEPYRDSVGVWTIGIGHTAAAGEPDPAKLPRGKAITLDRAFELFRADIRRYEAEVARTITVSVSQTQFDAAVSFHYNTGAIGRATWVKTLNAGDVNSATEQIMNWLKPPEITSRRFAEMNLFRRGIYTHGGMATVYPADENGKVLWSQGRRMNVLERLQGGPTAPEASGGTRVPENPNVTSAPTGGLLAAIRNLLARFFNRKD